MRCPRCNADNDKVIDTRTVENNAVIRRRRECLECGNRFTTVERFEGIQLSVIKKDGTRQAFSREKILSGLVSACSKRPVSNEDLITLVNDVEKKLHAKGNLEISTELIGEMLMDGLKKLDKVAYVRFASVYRDFTDVDSFTQEISKISDN
ncbi:MAG: transcriptional regulator NrdR [Clostridia bacterium]|nr:transcriptional regulator NrdR [Clostridia bacterium]